MSKHTPGPWRIDLGMHGEPRVTPDNQFTYRIEAPQGRLFQWVADVKAACLTDTDLANARLIAAAPELLEALKDVFALMDEKFLVRNVDGDVRSDWAVKILPYIARLKKAHDAIAKAEGNDAE